MSEDEIEAHIMGVVLVEHFNINNGIDLFGNRSETVVMKELQKIHNINTYGPMDASTLTYQEIKYALYSLLFITYKRNGGIKEIKVAVVSNQRTYDRYDKSNGSYPTVNTDGVFLTRLIDNREHSTVTMLDTENDFLHAENDDYVLILICGKLEEVLVKLDKKLYLKYVITLKQGVPMLYVRLTKAIFGMMCSAMLFYNNLRRH